MRGLLYEITINKLTLSISSIIALIASLVPQEGKQAKIDKTDTQGGSHNMLQRKKNTSSPNEWRKIPINVSVTF